jgi:peptidoglycan/LPS O-acetylase OafA/YrhL
MKAGTSDFLNASRWVAALLVVLYHVYNISIGDPNHVVQPSLFWHAVHFLCGFGHIAVIAFFVISGFLVGGLAILRYPDKGFDAVDYFVHRFSRIYTVMIPALIAGYMFDWSGIKFFDSSGIYIHPDPFYSNRFGNDIANHLSLQIFVGNLMQLQMIIVSSLGSNGPLWSLANEWWYYVLFGLGMIAYRPGRLPIRVIAGGAIAIMAMVLPVTISLWFVMWGIGAGVAVLDRYWAARSFVAGAMVAVVCLIVVRWLAARQVHTGLATNFALDLATALGYSVALVCAKNLCTKNFEKRVRFRLLHRRLASFSYTVYLVHFPAMVFMAAFLKAVFDIGFLQKPTASAVMYMGVLVVLLYGYAWIFAAFTEAHTDAVRSRLNVAISVLRRQANFLLSEKVLGRANTAAPVNDGVRRPTLSARLQFRLGRRNRDEAGSVLVPPQSLPAIGSSPWLERPAASTVRRDGVEG